MKAILYARFSPRPRHAVERTESCETQLEVMRIECERVEWDIEGEYADRGRSGADMDRPAFRQAMEHAKRVKGVLMVHSLSRFARSTKGAIEAADELRAAGAHWCSLHERIDTTTPLGQFVFQVLSAMAQLERVQIGARTSEAMRRYQREGRRMSSRCPYGWGPDPTDARRMVPVEAEQADIADAVRLHQGGLSPADVARQFRREGRQYRGGRWRWENVRALLRRAAEAAELAG